MSKPTEYWDWVRRYLALHRIHEPNKLALKWWVRRRARHDSKRIEREAA